MSIRIGRDITCSISTKPVTYRRMNLHDCNFVLTDIVTHLKINIQLIINNQNNNEN